MLKITVGEQSWRLDKDSMTVKEAKAVERYTGVRMSQIGTAGSDFDDMIILVWLARRRDGEPNLDINDVDFKISEVSVEDEDDPTDVGDEPVPTVPTGESVPAG